MRARCDDRSEARRFSAQPSHAQLELDRHVALAAPGEPRFEHATQRLVGELGSGTQALQLALVLDRSQALDSATAGLEPPAVGQNRAQPLVLGDRQARLVEAQRARLPGEPTGSGVKQAADDDLTIELGRDLLGRLRAVAEVGEERAAGGARVGAVGGADERETTAAGEAGQVAHVDRTVDDQRVDLTLAQIDRQSRCPRARLGRRAAVHRSACSVSRSRISSSASS